MSDFPQSHVTHTTTTTTTVNSGTGRVYFDVSYIKTIHGILRIVEIVLCIILFICAVSACGSVYYDGGSCGWGGFVGFMGFVIVFLWLMFHMFHVYDAVLPNAPWLLIEFIWYIVWTFFLVIAGIALAVMSGRYSGLLGYYKTISQSAGVGAFFAFAAAVVFGIQSFFLFRDWRARSASTRTTIQGHP